MRYSLALIFFLCLIVPGSALAVAPVGSEFSVSVFTGEDTEPPSTPTSTIAVPIAPTQIDVSWAAATDNVFLIGYTVARDGTVIATTSQTSFSDTGLAPTTTYTYTIRAYDQARNYSSSSEPVATTTLAPPPPPPTATSTVEADPDRAPTQGTIVRLQLDDFGIAANETSARISWRTNTASRYALRWGRTDAYELGYILDDVYRRSHENTLTDLEPGMEYAFELIGVTVGGAETVLQRGTFTTAAAPVAPPVPNVHRLTARVEGGDVFLSWDSPDPNRFAYVRVLRSPYRVPLDPQSGALVYQGRGSRVRDADALAHYSPQYYTVFVVDAAGRVSSGAVAVAHAIPPEAATASGAVPDDPSLPVQVVPPYTAEVFAATGTPLLPLRAIALEQGGEVQRFSDPSITLLADAPFSVSVSVPPSDVAVQSLIATLLDPTDHRRQYTFLLRLNADRSAYEATVAPLDLIGTSRLEVAVFDFSNRIVSRYRHQLDFTPSPRQPAVIFPDALIPYALPLAGATLLCAVFLLSIARRRRCA